MNDITVKQVLVFIFRVLRPFPFSVFLMLLVGLVWAIETSVSPYLVKIIVDRASVSSATHLWQSIAAPVIGYISLLFFLELLFRLYNYFFEVHMTPTLRKNIAELSVAKLLEQDHNYYQNNFSGSLANKVNDLTNCVPEIVEVTVNNFVNRIFMLGIAVYFLWQTKINFALLMLGWSLLLFFFSLSLAKKVTSLADRWSELNSGITGKMVDIFSNIMSIRLFANKSWEKLFFRSTYSEAVKGERKLKWLYLWIFSFFSLSFLIMQVLNLYFLIKGREQGLITVGDFSFVMSVNVSIGSFLWMMTVDFSYFSTLWGKITQALRTIMSKPDIQDQPNATELVVTEGKISFDKVQFRYKEEKLIFQNKSVTIEPGQKVGIVGYSGAGKSTFVNLILRLHNVTSGSVLIDGQNIRCVTQDSLHRNIGIIPQDPSLFHRTVMENIRYGKINASDEEVIRAAQRAHAHEFIEKLKEGYNSLVGERGVKLSGGQRQRIAIARAFLKDAPILILDEATSHLDSVTEQDIQETLWKLMKNKTTIVVAHRLSTLLRMDRILVFDQGEIVEDGTHEVLFNKEGLYKTLWNAQISGFLPDKKESASE